MVKNDIKLGMYRHYKGGLCEVLGIARHSETLEEVVVYKHGDLWVRPVSMFTERVSISGKLVPRFKYIGG